LKRQAGWLLSRAHAGILEKYQAKEHEDFDMKKNSQIVNQTIAKIINREIETTFVTLRHMT